MLPNKAPYNVHHSALAVFNNGARCRTCVRVYSPNPNLPVDFCPDHDARNNSEEASLGRAVRLMQDKMILRAVETMPSFVNTPVKGASDSQHWWWQVMCVLKVRCEDNLEYLEPFLRRYWQSGLTGPNFVTVRNISEVKFFPEDYYWYRHCVFEIELQSGVSYIFDPTGVQFGPEWPLLSLRHVYEDQRFHQYPPFRKEVCQPLGRQVAWRAGGSKGEY